MSNKNKIEEKKIIFIDFFDTIMHRHIHPLLVEKQAHELAKREGKDYAIVLKFAEIGCQYPNIKLVERIKQLKAKGKKIYIVSDFHMGKQCYIDFLTAKNIDPLLFDDIFISSECGCTKAKGDLYGFVLNKIAASANDVIMIGDNRRVDGKNANKYGIETLVIPHYWEKTVAQVRRFFKWDYSTRAAKKIRKDLYNYGSPFSEYALLFYLSTRELYKKLYGAKQNRVIFLAREGHFLKRAFDAYEIYFESKSIETSYLKCSRRAAQSLVPVALKDLENRQISIFDYLMAHGFSKDEIKMIANKYGIQSDIHESIILKNNTSYLKLISIQSYNELIQRKREDNKKAGKLYFASFDTGEVINLVDIGWRGRMQDTIGNILEKNTMGYYVGLNDSELNLNNREGLLFCSCPKQGKISPWSPILKANIQLYEQLTAAPHGSAVGYRIEGNVVVVEEDWVENEKKLYFEQIKTKQDELLLNILGFSAWCSNVSYEKLLKLCAKTVLRSGLFADKKRIAFLNSLDSGFVWNFDKQTKGIKYNKDGVRIKLDIISSPERYTRYLVKIQRGMARKGKIMMAFYYPLACIAYGYIWIINSIKNI